MSEFYKLNQHSLRKKFQKQLAQMGALGSVADPQSQETMFSNFVQSEEAAAHNSPTPYTLPLQSKGVDTNINTNNNAVTSPQYGDNQGSMLSQTNLSAYNQVDAFSPKQGASGHSLMTNRQNALRVGQAGGKPKQGKAHKVVDSNKEALEHYYYGNGAPVELGPKTKSFIINHPEQQMHLNRITSGVTSDLDGDYGIDMRPYMYHVGNTNIYYTTTCAGGRCKTIFTNDKDGFWDITYFSDDGIGPSGELGGTPYAYSPFSWTINFKSPYIGKLYE